MPDVTLTVEQQVTENNRTFRYIQLGFVFTCNFLPTSLEACRGGVCVGVDHVEVLVRGGEDGGSRVATESPLESCGVVSAVVYLDMASAAVIDLTRVAVRNDIRTDSSKRTHVE